MKNTLMLFPLIIFVIVGTVLALPPIPYAVTRSPQLRLLWDAATMHGTFINQMGHLPEWEAPVGSRWEYFLKTKGENIIKKFYR